MLTQRQVEWRVWANPGVKGLYQKPLEGTPYLGSHHKASSDYYQVQSSRNSPQKLERSGLLRQRPLRPMSHSATVALEQRLLNEAPAAVTFQEIPFSSRATRAEARILHIVSTSFPQSLSISAAVKMTAKAKGHGSFLGSLAEPKL